MQTAVPLHPELFCHDGRGPQLLKAHYGHANVELRAIKYLNPKASSHDGVKTLIFIKPQVFMFTPEEVGNYDDARVDWSKTGNAALVSLGRSPWLLSFAPSHLGHCTHFRAMFYDQYLDVICESIEVRQGGLSGASKLQP